MFLLFTYLPIATGRLRSSRQLPIDTSATDYPAPEVVGLRTNGSENIDIVGNGVHSQQSGKGSELATSKEVPIYMASGDSKHPLIEKRLSRNFTRDEMSALNYTASRGFKNFACTPSNTIFDLGFYDGADTKAYLEGGFCVKAFEADPSLINMGVLNFGVWMSTGQLALAHVALSPSESEGAQWKTFYLSKCTREWNSFYPTVGCRSCVPPHVPDYQACSQIPVRAVPCSAIFSTFGKPLYLKLDIEGAEPGCFEAMLSDKGRAFLPQYVSSEITELSYLDKLHEIGFRSFKLVRQDGLHSGIGSHSGPWGDNALDCRRGASWRTYEEVRAEFAMILYKPFNPSDACPGGICPIHGNGCNRTATTYMWYDVHVTWGLPSTHE